MPNELETPIQPGDEICVGRWLGAYAHHGVYVGDGRVVQFGAGIKDKPRASVHLAWLEDFAKGGEVRVVAPRGSIIQASLERALWLLENPPPVEYHLFGHNCEHVSTGVPPGERGKRSGARRLSSTTGSRAAACSHSLSTRTEFLVGLLLLGCRGRPSAGSLAAPRAASSGTWATPGLNRSSRRPAKATRLPRFPSRRGPPLAAL